MSSMANTRFETTVDQWIIQAVTAGAASFDELLVALPSVYPTVIPAALDRLATIGVLSGEAHARLQRRSHKNLPVVHYRQRGQVLPAPHPLDYDWRFTPEAVALLLQESQRLNPDNTPLALLVLQPEFVIFTVRWLAGGSGRHGRGPVGGVAATTSAIGGRDRGWAGRPGRRTGAGSRCRSTG
jgi:hypothetical protein